MVTFAGGVNIEIKLRLVHDSLISSWGVDWKNVGNNNNLCLLLSLKKTILNINKILIIVNNKKLILINFC